MKDLYIAGAGGCGREILGMLIDSQAIRSQKYNIKGFLDDTKSSFEDVVCDYPIVGTIQDYFPGDNDLVIMGVARPEGKLKIASLLKPRGVVFESFIHPYASLGHYNRIGEGVVIYGGFGMTVNTAIGDFVTLQTCYLGHDVEIGDFTTVSSFCNLMGYAHLGKGVFLGSNVAVAPNVTIGDGAYVCLGSIVAKNVGANSKVMGNPAREIG